MKIAVDLNGGDRAPKVVIKGMELALKLGYIKPDELLGLGTVGAVESAQKEKKIKDVLFLVCDEAIEMGDGKDAIRKKKNSTIAEGIRLLKKQQAEPDQEIKKTPEAKVDAFVSAGNTAGMVFWGAIILSRFKRGISPAIAVPLPNEEGPCLLLDAGAIPDARSLDLVYCAIMGSIYAREIWRLDRPIINLLNIGSEASKGNETLRLANQILTDLNKAGKINYQGNIEGDKIFTTPVNVIVCPGEIGNNTIKVAEGVKNLIESKIGWLYKLISFFWSHHKKSDYQEVGGAILLGINGIEIIAHGKSQPLAIANAIRRAKLEVEANIPEIIQSEIDDEEIEQIINWHLTNRD